MTSTTPVLFWAKSSPAHSLVGHLLDTGAVAELLWDDYIPPSVRQRLDGATGGHGRDVFVLSCATHDLGKATPAFQAKAYGCANGDELLASTTPHSKLDQRPVRPRRAFVELPGALGAQLGVGLGDQLVHAHADGGLEARAELGVDRREALLVVAGGVA